MDRRSWGRAPVTYIRADQLGTEMRCTFNEWTASYIADYDLWSCHSLVGYGSSIWEVVGQAGHDPGELDGIIRGGPNPYEGLSDLVRRFCARLRGLEVRGTTTVVELIAPLAVRFDAEAVTSSSEGITACLKAAHHVYVENAKMAWTAGSAGQPPRHGSRELSECKWTGERGALHAELNIPIQRGDSTATLFILIGDRCVDHVSVPTGGGGRQHPDKGAPHRRPRSSTLPRASLPRQTGQGEGVRGRRGSALLLPRLPCGSTFRRRRGWAMPSITLLTPRDLPSFS